MHKQVVVEELGRCLALERQSVWGRLSPATQEQIKIQILEALKLEKDIKVLRPLCSLVADFSLKLTPPGQALFPFIFQCIKSPDEYHRISGFAILSDLAVLLGYEVFAPHMSQVITILHMGLKDPSIQVKAEAIYTISSFATISPPTSPLQSFLPLMLETLNVAVWQKNEEESKRIISDFVELCSLQTHFFNPHLSDVLSSMFLIASSPTNSDEIRQSAVEFLVLYAETFPTIKRKQPTFVSTIVPFLLELLATVPENDQWETDFETENHVTNSAVGEGALDRISLALGGTAVCPVLLSSISSMLINKADWRKRWAGLVGLGVCAEGCHSVMRKHMPEILSVVVSLFEDEHPRVRWAACHCIAQFSTDIPLLQKQFFDVIMPPLLRHFSDSSLRVQVHSIDAMAEFVRECPVSKLEPVLEQLLSQLLPLLSHPHPQVGEVALQTISELARASDKSFSKYYTTLVPLLKNIIKTSDSARKKLQYTAMECLSFIAVSAGKELFQRDAQEILPGFLALLPELDSSDPEKASYVHSAICRFSECLGQDFSPFLCMVVPPLLTRASGSIDVQLFEKQGCPQEGWDVFRCGEREIGVNTSSIEAKTESLLLLSVYGSIVKEHFVPFIPEIVRIIVENMKCAYSDEVRSAAASLIPILFECIKAQEKKNPFVQVPLQFWQDLYKGMLSTMASEPSKEILLVQIDAIMDTLDHVDARYISVPDLLKFIDFTIPLYSMFQRSNDDRQMVRARTTDLAEEDTELIAAEEKTEYDVVARANTCIMKMANFSLQLQQCYISRFTTDVLPILLNMMREGRCVYERCLALCAFDDIIDLSWEEAKVHLPHFSRVLLESTATNKHPPLRQSAAYGLGICGMKGGDDFTPLALNAVAILCQALQDPSTSGEDWASANDNVVSAILKICISPSGKAVDKASVFPIVLKGLPITEDEVEANLVYFTLSQVLHDTPALILGRNFEYLEKVIQVIAAVVSNFDLVTPEINLKFAGFLHLLTQPGGLSGLPPCPQEKLVQIWSALSEQAKMNLNGLQSLFQVHSAQNKPTVGNL
ncbi:importin 5 [Pelomyxa schiedti]|nr:importin 5 [Pelomyxa schiedti]